MSLSNADLAVLVLIAGDADVIDGQPGVSSGGNPVMPPTGDPAISYLTAAHFEPLAQIRANDLFAVDADNQYYGLVCRCTAAVGALMPGDTLIAIRGTLSAMEWLNNLGAIFPVANPEGFGGSVGGGFLGVFDSMTLSDMSGKHIAGNFWANLVGLAKGSTRLFLVGHSLGAALAGLMAPRLQQALLGVPCELIPAFFAQPNIGAFGFGEGFLKSVPAFHAVAFEADVVPQVPGFPFERLKAGGPTQNVIALPRGGPGAPPAPELDFVTNHDPHTYSAMLLAT
jgi:hypothetical protein